MAAPAVVTLEAYGRAGAMPPRAPQLSRSSRIRADEVEARTALTVCGLPGTPYSLNPYQGCGHGCAYCYVPSVIHEDQGAWGGWVRAKRNLPLLLAREVRRKPRGLVFLSSATDPYQPVEGTYGLTRHALAILADADWPLRVLTRNPLVLRDIDLLSRFSDVHVGLSVPTFDDGFRRVLEPKAPPIQGRLRALRALADAGLPTYASLAPTYPLTEGLTPEDVAGALRDAGVRRVFLGAWAYEEKARPATLAHLRGTPYEALGPRLFDPQASRKRITALRRALWREGIRETREDPGEIGTRRSGDPMDASAGPAATTLSGPWEKPTSSGPSAPRAPPR